MMNRLYFFVVCTVLKTYFNFGFLSTTDVWSSGMPGNPPRGIKPLSGDKTKIGRKLE